MASTAGLATWKKYFEGKGDVPVVLKKATTLKPVGKHTAVSLREGDTVTLKSLKNEKEYLSYAGGRTGPKVVAWIPVEYKNKEYLCTIENMSKPSKTGRIDLKLQTSNMLSKAKITKLDIFGEKNVDCAIFSKASDLAESCNAYIRTNKLLDKNKNFKKSLEKYFDSNNHVRIELIGAIDDGEIAEFKYLGEVCVGIILLENKTAQAISGSNPFAGKKIKRMIYPLSESFKGADVIAETGDGDMIPLSLKAGTGAAASFFGNLYPIVAKNKKYRPDGSVIKKIWEAATDIGATEKDPKKIVYEYGIRNILGLGKSKISNTYKVFEEFKKYDKMSQYSPDVRVVYSALEKKMKELGDKVALDRLDSSTTVFFCKNIANEFNADSKSIGAALSALGEKNFYQVNLDIKSVKSGSLKFTATKVPGQVASFEMKGTKSAYTNIDASQGTLNYILS
jgi:hypothetical protein